MFSIVVKHKSVHDFNEIYFYCEYKHLNIRVVSSVVFVVGSSSVLTVPEIVLSSSLVLVGIWPLSGWTKQCKITIKVDFQLNTPRKTDKINSSLFRKGKNEIFLV